LAGWVKPLVPKDRWFQMSDEVKARLLENRRLYRDEMIRACRAKTKVQKKRLLEDWRTKYNEQIVEYLLRLARGPYREEISRWSLEEWYEEDKKRLSGKGWQGELLID